MGQPTPEFSEHEKKFIGGEAKAVLDECAYDLLESIAEEKGKSVNDVFIKRDEAIEIALDAGRLEQRLRAAIRRGQCAQDLLQRWQMLNYQQGIDLVKPAFPFSRYGL